jgi:hypothetical protein
MLENKHKYIKYKNKYLRSFNQKAGELCDFENFFNFFVNLCLEYNSINFPNLIHIKGGASIKYHLQKANKEHIGITNDIDILLILDDPNSIITHFIDPIKRYTTEHGLSDLWQTKTDAKILQLSYNNCLVDITVYHKETEHEIDDDSMFDYALQNLGFSNIHEYIAYIKQINDLESLTFTSIDFEKFSTEKGIINMNRYLNENLPFWRNIVEENKNRVLSPFDMQILERYKYQISEPYIQKLRDKHIRYIIKSERLKCLL